MKFGLTSVLVASGLLVFISQSNSTKLGLYDSSVDPVVILDKHNFNSSSTGSSSSWIVEYYNQWCGTCIDFVPKWREFSAFFEDLNFIKIGVVNCVSDVTVCAGQRVTNTPTIKYYKPNLTRFDEGKDVNIGSYNRVPDMIETVLDHFQEDSESFGLQPSAFEDVRFTELEELKKLTRKPVKHVFLIIEHPNFPFGRSLIFELRKETQLRILLSSNENIQLISNLKKEFQMEGSDRWLLHVAADLVNVTKIDAQKNPCHYANHIREIIGVKKVAIKTAVATTEQFKYRNVTLSKDRVSIVDLRNAITYLLRNEIKMHQVIRGEHMDALKKFVSVINAYFPGNKSERAFIMRINQWLQSKTEITKDKWTAALKPTKGEETVFGKLLPWEACLGSESHLRGYPCSLWMTFHFVLMQDYVINKYNKRHDPLEVLNAIHGYVKYFFGCRECSKHFQQMANATMRQEVRNAADAPLWLWSAHNKVNKRLAGSATEDRSHPKMQFPSQAMCPQCRYKINDSQQTWNQTVVLDFLVKFYSKESLDAAPANGTLVSVVDKFQFKLSEMFNFFDMGICLFLYQLMFLLVCSFYIMFVCKRRRRRARKSAKESFPV